MTQTLCRDDFHYFAEMKKEPKEIFFRGNRELLSRPKVSIVGTRKPTQYTKQMTADLAHRLANVGVAVVSGGAMGVDGQAHFGAGYANTIAVMPCGLDIRYPTTHRDMFEQIENDGLLLSMYEEGTLAANWTFVARNEMVVALGDVLIVSEALRNSGSMRSVEYAQKMGKKIYTFPHRSGESDGTMDLVKAGEAEIIYDIDKFVSQYGQSKAIENDDFLQFCQSVPSYEEALQRFGEKLSLYELEGKITVKDGRVSLC